METSNNGTKSISEQLSDQVNRPDFVYSDRLLKMIMRWSNDFEERNILHLEAVEETQRRPLRRVLQFDYIGGAQDDCEYRWRNELKDKDDCVSVQITSDVKPEEAIRRLMRIIEILNVPEAELWMETSQPPEMYTSHGRVIALPELEAATVELDDPPFVMDIS